jgi:iron complex transport system substrate-binding protein|tara:strand:+ start:6048 stop:6893 length:846 start_codon:yes stop_codon:yes gene_type:complete
VSSDAISVVDDIGRRVSLPAPATRIVSLSPHITELLYSIGIGDRIVGTVRYSDYPKEAGSIQRVGDAFSINIEMLIQLEPDLVVAWQTGGSARTINKIQSFLGVPVYFNEASDLAAIGESAAKMAVLAGVAEIGAARAQQYRRKLEWIREQHESSNQVKIFYQISDLDLYTVNRHHLIGEAIALCGGDNIFADSIIKVPKVSMEAVIAASPDLIVFSSGVDAGDQWTSRWRPFDTIPAVANEHLYSLPAAILTRPSFRMASGIERLCDFMNMARSQAPVKD